tara:strand:+ start:42 stop:1235 length:1194 start_codon:yes stop_codon:yes gene_type:complete
MSYQEISFNDYLILKTSPESNKYSCLRPNDICYNHVDLEHFIKDNFHIYDFNFNNSSQDNHMLKCSEKARFENAEFFLTRIKDVDINNDDLTYNINSNTALPITENTFLNDGHYNINGTDRRLVVQCIIPKSKCSDSDDLNNYLDPNKQILKDMFQSDTYNDLRTKGVEGGDTNTFNFNPLLDPLNVTDDSLNLFNARKNDSLQEKCVSYTIDPTSAYGFMSKRTFTLYRTNLFENYNNDILTNFTPYQDYRDIYDMSYDIKVFDNTVKIPYIDYLVEKWTDFMCNSVSQRNNTLSTINTIYTSTASYITALEDGLDILNDDLSNITFSLRENINFIKKQQSEVNKKARILEDNLDKNSANNGRLHDTLFHKNLKITEVIILSSVIILILFIYMKKK